MKERSSEATDRPFRNDGIYPAAAEVRWGFGSFMVWEDQRRLESSGQAVKLGSRSFDLLLQLLRRAGELISKDELLSGVWGNVVVEEASVRVHLSQLRKALGEPGESDECREWISTVPLRGYRFNGTVCRELIDTSVPLATDGSGTFARPPVRLTELVGRETDMANILKALDNHRLVTIVGPGGIGKTSVAISVAERRQRTSAMEVAFVDLAPLISAEHVLGNLARSLGIAADLPESIQAINRCLAGRNVLLLVDNCEQVIDSLVLPLTRLLSASPGLRILATSRETLRLSGEYVYRLPALAVPDAEHFLLAQAMRWPAVELFVNRARAAGAGAFVESDGPLLARISRQLDGIPLAIELVAARLAAQSVDDLALRLDDHMRPLSIRSRRSALARHESLAAALDWSIALLNADELRVFGRLSVFRGCFDVEGALGVTVGDAEQDINFNALISLAHKSLVSFDSNVAIAPYRLLDTTRSYAARLLEQTGERPTALWRHARHMLERMKVAATDLPKLGEQAWGDRYAHHLDDVRFALTFCLTESDANLGASLACASAPLWFHVSQVAEYRDWVVAALKVVDQQPEPDVELATRLNSELIIALLNTHGPNVDLEAACDRALEGALAIQSRALELKVRWGRSMHDIFSGEYAASLHRAETLFDVAQSWSDPAVINLAHRACAMASYFCGRFEASRHHCEASLQLTADAENAGNYLVGVSPSVAANALLSRVLWIQGETTQALAAASAAVNEAGAMGHAVSLFVALYCACPVALWSGEVELAGKWVRMMGDEARRRGQLVWLRYAEWYSHGLQLQGAENPEIFIRDISGRFATFEGPCKELLATFCSDWVDDQLIARISRGEAPWCAAEVWRAAGWRSERRGIFDDAEGFYLRALEISRKQGAKAWELRAASSLARLWAGTGRPQQAVQLLDETLGRAVPDGRNRAIAQTRELRGAIALEVQP